MGTPVLPCVCGPHLGIFITLLWATAEQQPRCTTPTPEAKCASQRPTPTDFLLCQPTQYLVNIDSAVRRQRLLSGAIFPPHQFAKTGLSNVPEKNRKVAYRLGLHVKKSTSGQNFLIQYQSGPQRLWDCNQELTAADRKRGESPQRSKAPAHSILLSVQQMH